MKLLSIIIPRYSEPIGVIRRNVSSIYIQSQFSLNDLEVIIADDNPESPLSDVDVQGLFDTFGIEIKHPVMERNGGPGLARQLGIDVSDGKYLMFIDADDSLYSSNVLRVLFNEIEKFPETDYMSSHWIEELYDKENNNYLYVQHDLENTWMHGKLIKKSLLTENNIRFHPDLRVHEDSYFLSLVADVAKSRRLLTVPTYLWRYSERTITRRNDGLYLYEDFPTFIKSIGLANAELRKHGSPMIYYHVVQLVLYCFFTLQQDIWIKPDVSQYRKASIDTLKDVMRGQWDIYDSADGDMIRQTYKEERNKHFNANEIEHYSLYEWITMLKK